MIGRMTLDEETLMYGQPEAFLQDLFGPDFVLPEQFYGAKDNALRLSGERALMWAVFADGIDTYRRSVGQASARERLEFREADAWVAATDWEWACSFVNLCDMFGFDADAVRTALRGWRHSWGQAEFRRQRFRPITMHAAA